MKIVMTLVAVFIGMSAGLDAQQSKIYVGVVTDTMCVSDHKPMNINPDAKCVRDCVGEGKVYKYALTDGTHTYKLSDQETPAQFSGTKVRVIGVLYPKTGIIKVERIEAAR